MIKIKKFIRKMRKKKKRTKRGVQNFTREEVSLFPYTFKIRQDKEGQFARFREGFKELYIIVPFTEASRKMSMYVRLQSFLLQLHIIVPY